MSNDATGSGERVRDERTGRGGIRRRWVPWAAVGAVVALGGAAALAVPLLTRSGEPATAPTSISPTAASPEASAESPSPAACVVTAPEVTWRDPSSLSLPTDGNLESTVVQEVPWIDVEGGLWPEVFAVDDETFGVISTNGTLARSSLALVDRAGRVEWNVELDGRATVLSTPARTGVEGRIVVLVSRDEEAPLMQAWDLDTGKLASQEEASGEVYPVSTSASVAASADIAPRDADAFYVADRGALTRVDATTLQPQWSFDAAAYGVGELEGGVPFSVLNDIAFAGGHALDVDSGRPLGWETAGTAFVAGGVTLEAPLRYDAVGPYTVSGLDTRTGDTCWSRDVLDIAATADALWLLTPDGAIERVDPHSGTTTRTLADVSADHLDVAGHFLLAVDSGEEGSAVALATVFDQDEQIGAMEIDSGASVHMSGDQIVIATPGNVTVEPTLSAYRLPAIDPVWLIDVDAVVAGGVVLQTVIDGDAGAARVVLLH
jgi:outer membrane protein assembly factor BamB